MLMVNVSLEEELEEIIWKQLIYLWQIRFWPVTALLLASASDWNRAMKTEPSGIDDRTCYSVHICEYKHLATHFFTVYFHSYPIVKLQFLNLKLLSNYLLAGLIFVSWNTLSLRSSTEILISGHPERLLNILDLFCLQWFEYSIVLQWSFMNN